MEPKPIRTASHIGLWILVIGLIIFLSWSAVNKKTESNDYAKGSTHIETTVNDYPLSFGGCMYIKPDGVKNGNFKNSNNPSK